MQKGNIFVLQALILIAVISNSCSMDKSQSPPPAQSLETHLAFSTYTDPGDYIDLYMNLPDSMEELCQLIKRQLIHPFDVKKYGDRIPEDRAYEDRVIPSVSQMLAELQKRDNRGLVYDRQPEDRLVVACVHHSMLLASILRQRGIPVRIRVGFAHYIGNDRRVRVSHAVCEVWSQRQKRWFIVDPDRQRFDLPEDDFEFSWQSWDHLRNQKINKDHYISRYSTVDQAIVHLLCHDLSYLIGVEEPYWIDPPIVSKIVKNIGDLSEAELQLLDDLAILLRNPERHLKELYALQTTHSILQYSGELAQ